MVHPVGLVLVGEQRRPDVDRHEGETVFEVSVFTLFLATAPYREGGGYSNNRLSPIHREADLVVTQINVES